MQAFRRRDWRPVLRLVSGRIAWRPYTTRSIKDDGLTLKNFMGSKGDNKILDFGKPTNPEVMPYLEHADVHGLGRKVYIETYGCQMNVSDAEVAWAMLKQTGYERVNVPEEAEVILLVTCSIRENAESKIWGRLKEFRGWKRKQRFAADAEEVTVGVLGCMAERLKTKLLEQDGLCDLVAGPDSYRHLPVMLSAIHNSSDQAVNVALSLDETYADVRPVRINPDKPTAFLSIMRGCNNMCSYCIVPFTRGRERSRDVGSIADEVRYLRDAGIKDITLLGQNVNSYNDRRASPVLEDSALLSNENFRTIYRRKDGGARFADLLYQVAESCPDVRFRFTSPHPKDFPPALIDVIAEKHNVCKQIHLPAQSGSDYMLQRMRRGYTRDAYQRLVMDIRSKIPDIALSTDMIVGFCGESEEDHLQSMVLMKEVGYDYAFMFAYSDRGKTHAARNYEDDVPAEVKQERLKAMIDQFYTDVEAKTKPLHGTHKMVLVEKYGKKDPSKIYTRDDGNRRVVVDVREVPDLVNGGKRQPAAGDFLIARVDSGKVSLNGTALALADLVAYHKDGYHGLWQQKLSGAIA
eukprot:Clim_evm103s153 gene=Clim_evmTU103s153